MISKLKRKNIKAIRRASNEELVHGFTQFEILVEESARLLPLVSDKDTAKETADAVQGYRVWFLGKIKEELISRGYDVK